MSAREPQETAEVAVKAGTKKTQRTWDRVLVSSFLAGAYIAFGGLVAITISSGLDPKTWGTLPTLFMGAAFTLGLVLVLIAGSDLAIIPGGHGEYIGEITTLTPDFKETDLIVPLIEKFLDKKSEDQT